MKLRDLSDETIRVLLHGYERSATEYQSAIEKLRKELKRRHPEGRTFDESDVTTADGRPVDSGTDDAKERRWNRLEGA